MKIFQVFANLSTKEKRLAHISAIVFCITMGDYLIYKPVTIRMRKVNRSITAHERKIEKDMRILSLKKRVTEEYHKNTTPLTMEGSNEEEIAKFLNTIEVLSRESYVSLIDMKPHMSREEDSSLFKTYSVEVEVEAPMEKIVIFFYNLQTSPQLLRINKFNIKKKKKGEDDETINMYLTITKVVIKKLEVKG